MKKKRKWNKILVANLALWFHFQEFIEELKIYFLFFDRAGYGDSDPNPSRSVKSEAYDVQELADKLQIGSKFYVIGISMGAYPVYSCLKYIPHRHVTQFVYNLQASYIFLLFDITEFLLSNYTKCKELLWQWLFSYLQIGRSFSGSSICPLLVALSSCQFIK